MGMAADKNATVMKTPTATPSMANATANPVSSVTTVRRAVPRGILVATARKYVTALTVRCATRKLAVVYVRRVSLERSVTHLAQLGDMVTGNMI
ncbi:unnamed protein product [Nippostrongylus brasiliensis]|uniref:Uncharacterized protein n=1 Tax=Nippostrongylus brasiliensis TaxID=27835 RepID=A0A0N4XS58_NIPBR|nr:unnamed protein product [Nippostrongylus brasiliensis]